MRRRFRRRFRAAVRSRWKDSLKIQDRLEHIGPVAAVPKHVAKRVHDVTAQIKLVGNVIQVALDFGLA